MGRFKRYPLFLSFYIFAISGFLLFFPANWPFRFPDYFFPALAVSVLATATFPMFERWKLLPILSIWWLFYGVVWYQITRDFTSSGSIFFAVELALLSFGVFLARQANVSINEMERTLNKLVFSSFTGRAVMIDEAAEEIKTELTRSRRYHRPLSLIIIEPDANAIQEEVSPTLKEIEDHMARRYMMAHLAEIIDKEARRTDLIIKQDRPDRFILLCPETQSSSTNTLIRRIAETAHEKTGLLVGFGVASFPEEALTFEELINRANAKLVHPSAYTLQEQKQPVKLNPHK